MRTPPLPPTPLSVARARDLAEAALAGSAHEPLLDSILLIVSELVTNAILHAGTDVTLTVSIDPTGVRIEVADGSPILPTRRSYDDDASTGRGLGLVALLATDLGVQRHGDGKVVWATVRADAADAGAQDPDEVLARWSEADSAAPVATDTRTVRLLGVPVRLFRAMQQHNDALLREHALMSSGHQGAAPPHLDTDFSQAEVALRAAADQALPAVDLELPVGSSAPEGARALLDVLASADEQAFVGNMLTPAALPEVRWCRVWHLEEIARQAGGAAPRPWAPLDVQHRELEGIAEIDARTILDTLTGAVVVGDDQNRITYLNRAAADLLGWPASDLEGKRLTAIVPERLREAHIAGYTRYLITSEPRLIGRPVRVPARRRDGTEVEVELDLATLRTPDGRPLFVASLRELSERHAAGERHGALDAALSASTAAVELLAATAPPPALEEVAAELLAVLGTGLDLRVGVLWRCSEGGDGLAWLADWSQEPASHDAFLDATRSQRFAAGVGLPGRVLALGQPVVMRDIVAESSFRRLEHATAAGLRSGFGFPVRRAGQVVGVIELFSAELIDPHPDFIDTVASIGAHVGALTSPAGS